MNGIYLYFVNKHRSSWPLLGLKTETDRFTKGLILQKGEIFRFDQNENICRQQIKCSSNESIPTEYKIVVCKLFEFGRV